MTVNIKTKIDKDSIVEKLEDIKKRLDNPDNNSNAYFLMVDIKDIKKQIDKIIKDQEEKTTKEMLERLGL